MTLRLIFAKLLRLIFISPAYKEQFVCQNERSNYHYAQHITISSVLGMQTLHGPADLDKSTNHKTPFLFTQWFTISRISALAVVCCLASQGSNAQYPQWRFDRLTVDNGLSSFRVYDLHQDKQGFMWFATMDGLDRYDGHRFVSYKHTSDDSGSLSDNIVRAICEDESGFLWFGTQDGNLNRFNRVQEKFETYAHPGIAGRFPISSLYSDSEGRLWVCTLGGGLLMFKNAQTAHFSEGFRHFQRGGPNALGISSNRVFSIVEWPQGTFYIGTDDGLNILRNDSIRILRNDPRDINSLCDDLVVSLRQHEPGEIWIGTGNGLSVLNTATDKFTNYVHHEGQPNSLSHHFVTSTAKEDDRFFWVSTQSGLNRLDRQTGRSTRFASDPLNPVTLADDYVIRLRKDRAGNIWMGTNRGVGKIVPRRSRFSWYHHSIDPREEQGVMAILVDRKESVWIGTKSALKIFDPSGRLVRSFQHDPMNSSSLPAGFVQSIVEDSLGTIWVGTLGSGVSRYDPLSNAFIPQTLGEKGTKSTQVLCMISTLPGYLWVGTSGDGLLRVNVRDGSTLRFLYAIHDTTNLRNVAVTALALDRSSNLWIGTEGAGLGKLMNQGDSRNTLQFFEHHVLDSGSLSNNRVYSLLEDSRGRLWVATGDGLDMFDHTRGVFQHPLRYERSFAGIILSMLEDPNGRIWLATTQHGLYRFDPENGELISFDDQDGLQSNQFYHANFKGADGRFWFGGERGFNAFVPESVRVHTVQGTPFLTDFKVFGESIDLDSAISTIGTITLNHDQNFFSFEFSSIDLTSPGKNRYEYILDGFDKRWTNSGTRTLAIYTSVHPGEYVFRVRGTNSYGIWQPQNAIVTVIVKPPFWATWWFRSIAAIFLLVVGYWFYRLHIERIIHVERVRMSIANDLHDDLGSNLAGIALTSDRMRADTTLGEEHRRQLVEIGTKARGTAEAIRDMVWVINPEHKGLDTLVLKLQDEATTMLNGIECKLVSSLDESITLPNMEFGRNILLIFKEVLHNVVKHSRATNVEIDILLQDRFFLLRVTDNGSGFEPQVKSQGHGLKSIRVRVDRIGGVMKVQSSPLCGTSIQISLKIP